MVMQTVEDKCKQAFRRHFGDKGKLEATRVDESYVRVYDPDRHLAAKFSVKGQRVRKVEERG